MTKIPQPLQDEFIFAPSARLGQNVVTTGKVTLGPGTSLWHNVVIRGDVAPILIGAECNIQDNTVLHGQLHQHDVRLGDRVSIGHSCILHGCHLADESFIGMGSIVMNGCVVGSRVLVAAGSLLPPGSQFLEPGMLVMGRPAKVVRPLRQSELEMILETPGRYLSYAAQWLPALKQ